MNLTDAMAGSLVVVSGRAGKILAHFGERWDSAQPFNSALELKFTDEVYPAGLEREFAVIMASAPEHFLVIAAPLY
jgi:hypothetical protein